METTSATFILGNKASSKAFKAKPLSMTNLSATVPAKLLVDPVNGYGSMLKALAKQLVSPFFHLFKFQLAYSGLLSAALKSYEKK